MSNSKDFFAQGLARRWENKKLYFFPLAVVLFFLVFTDWTTNVITAIIISPLLSTVKESSLIIDVIIILFAIAVQVIFIRKAWRHVKVSILYEGFVFSLSVIYLYYRINGSSSKFIFVPFDIPLLKHVFLADVLLSLVAAIFFYYILYYIRFINLKTIRSAGHGFYIDAPKILDEGNDVLARRMHVERLKEMILATDSPEHSFAIGIIGQWGTGKTTFLESLAKELTKRSDVIIVHFNPWLSNSPQGITSMFFADLSKTVSRYDDSLRNDLLSYATELLQTVDNVNVSPLKIFLSSFVNTKESTVKHELINKSIQRLNKKIIILVDDVDRLAKEEIVEVLRIIRNTGDFGNLFFLVAFDRVYVKRSIDELLMDNMEVNYLEKIFQFEYYLPINPHLDIFRMSLLSQIRKIVSDKNVEVVDEIISPSKRNFKIEFTPPIEEYVKSFRDVERYMNVFLLNYKEIEENIYLPDYLSICILRLKFPEIYKLLYYYKFYFFSDANRILFDSYDGVLYSQFDGNPAGKPEGTKLYKFLDEKKESLGLTGLEVKDAASLVFSTFLPKNDIYTLPIRRTLYNSHLSVTQNRSFNRYFDFSMEGRLDQKEFNEIMKKPIDVIQSKFKEWNKLRETNTDLGVKLENFQASDKETFEKHIQAVLMYEGLHMPESTDYYNSYSVDDLYSKLGGNDDEFNKVIRDIYGSDKELYKSFFRSLFLHNPIVQRWGLLQEFVQKLIKEYGDNFILNNEELKDLVKERFLLIIQSANKISYELLRYYINAFRLFQNVDDGYNNSKEFTDRAFEMSEKLKPFIVSNLSEFLNGNIYKDRPSRGYKLDDWPIYIFESIREFRKVLVQKKGDPLVDEYVSFCKTYIKNKKVPIDFKFLHLKVNE